jgi:hypothetical protein
MKKVENVEQAEDEKLNWKAQIFWSHRTWESTILEQVPDDKIVWRSKGEKGYVDGAVTFHELAPNLTRILLELEYHPQGLFERTGNLWRAQGRRARLELKHFRRHVMSEVILHPDDVEGWRGVIHDGEVVQEHEAGANGQGGKDQGRDGKGNGSAQRRGRTRTREQSNGEQPRGRAGDTGASTRSSRSAASSGSSRSSSGSAAGRSQRATRASGRSSRSSGAGERAQRTSRRAANQGGES